MKFPIAGPYFTYNNKIYMDQPNTYSVFPLTQWKVRELNCPNSCLSIQVLMHMKVYVMSSLSLSVNMRPCSSDSCLAQWLAIVWGLEVTLCRHVSTLWILIGRAGHRAPHCGVFSHCAFLDVQSVLADLRGHAEWCMGPKGVLSQKTEYAF